MEYGQTMLVLAGSIAILALLVRLMYRRATTHEWLEISQGERALRKATEAKGK